MGSEHQSTSDIQIQLRKDREGHMAVREDEEAGRWSVSWDFAVKSKYVSHTQQQQTQEP